MCHTQQFCGRNIAYNKLGLSGTIHVVDNLQERRRQIDIFASNIYGISGDHPQELLQKTRTSQRPNILTNYA